MIPIIYHSHDRSSSHLQSRAQDGLSPLRGLEPLLQHARWLNVGCEVIHAERLDDPICDCVDDGIERDAVMGGAEDSVKKSDT